MVKKIKLFLFVIMSIFVIFSYYDFVKSPYFSIKKINLVNKLNILDSDYRDYFGQFRGENIWEIDFNEVEDKLINDVRIKSVEISKELPDKLNIKIEEEEPFAKLRYNDELYFLNNYGKIFALEREIPKVDSIIIDVKKLEEIEILVEAVDELYKTNGDKLVSEIYIDNENRINLFLLDGTKIISDELVSWERYNTAFVLYEELLKKNEKINYIDIRFVDFIVN